MPNKDYYLCSSNDFDHKTTECSMFLLTTACRSSSLQHCAKNVRTLQSYFGFKKAGSVAVKKEDVQHRTGRVKLPNIEK